MSTVTVKGFGGLVGSTKSAQSVSPYLASSLTSPGARRPQPSRARAAFTSRTDKSHAALIFGSASNPHRCSKVPNAWPSTLTDPRRFNAASSAVDPVSEHLKSPHIASRRQSGERYKIADRLSNPPPRALTDIEERAPQCDLPSCK